MNLPEAAPRLGAVLIVWLLLVAAIAFACAPVALALAAAWGAASW